MPLEEYTDCTRHSNRPLVPSQATATPSTCHLPLPRLASVPSRPSPPFPSFAAHSTPAHPHVGLGNRHRQRDERRAGPLPPRALGGLVPPVRGVRTGEGRCSELEPVLGRGYVRRGDVSWLWFRRSSDEGPWTRETDARRTPPRSRPSEGKGTRLRRAALADAASCLSVHSHELFSVVTEVRSPPSARAAHQDAQPLTSSRLHRSTSSTSPSPSSRSSSPSLASSRAFAPGYQTGSTGSADPMQRVRTSQGFRQGAPLRRRGHHRHVLRHRLLVRCA